MNYRLINSDVIEGLRQLPDAIAQCVVTSPPYWGLRDYGTPAQVWGGRPECDHEWGDAIRAPWANDLPGPNGRKKNVAASRQRPKETGPFCQKCEAWHGSLGLEPTPELFVRNMTLVFREVRRVLRDDGVCFVNFGDSYYGSWQNYGGGSRGAGRQRLITKGSTAQNPAWEGREGYRPASTYDHSVLKPKDLCGIPWRIAFALQADGWWMRSDIIEEVQLYCPCGCGYELEERIWRWSQDREQIWRKPNPMPESVQDRPTKSHEYIFMLTKSAKYFYDAEAIKEPMVRGDAGSTFNTGKTADHQLGRSSQKPRRVRKPSGWNTGEGAHGSFHPNGRAESVEYVDEVATTRNRRSVWTMATQPNSEAHFATFPEELAEICIKAGTSERGCCKYCGAPWKRIVDKKFTPQPDVSPQKALKASNKGLDQSNGWGETPRGTNQTSTIGWQPSCRCEVPSGPIDSIVLDPFAGTSTTGVVALRLGRRFIGIDLNPEYIAISDRRLREAERQAYGSLFLPLLNGGME